MQAVHVPRAAGVRHRDTPIQIYSKPGRQDRRLAVCLFRQQQKNVHGTRTTAVISDAMRCVQNRPVIHRSPSRLPRSTNAAVRAVSCHARRIFVQAQTDAMCFHYCLFCYCCRRQEHFLRDREMPNRRHTVRSSTHRYGAASLRAAAG